MIVCHCHRINDSRIAGAAQEGCRHLREVVRSTRAGTGCGRCLPELRAVCERAFAAATAAAVTTVAAAAVTSLASEAVPAVASDTAPGVTV